MWESPGNSHAVAIQWVCMVKDPPVTMLHVHMIANNYTAFLSIMIESNYMALSAMCKYSTLLTVPAAAKQATSMLCIPKKNGTLRTVFDL